MVTNWPLAKEEKAKDAAKQASLIILENIVVKGNLKLNLEERKKNERGRNSS